MKYQILTAVLATIVIMFVGLMLIGWATEDDGYTPSSNYSSSYTAPSTNDDLLTEEEYYAYIEGCTEDGTSYSDCDCMIVYLEENYGRDVIIDMAENLNADSTWAKLEEAAYHCTGSYSF